MHLNYYTAVGTKLLKQQGRAKAAKAAATNSWAGKVEKVCHHSFSWLSQRLSDSMGDNKESLSLWLFWRDPQSRKEGSRRAARVPPLLAGVNQTQGTVLMTMWGKSIHVKQSRKRNWEGWKRDTCYELTHN